MVKKLTNTQILRQIPGARLRGRVTEAQPWWPKRVVYDPSREALLLTLRSGVEWTIPKRQIPELRRASAVDLVQVELSGEAIRWESLDIDLSIPGLAIDMLGETFFAKASGRIRGSVRSRAKAAAARTNGAKGGRPRKAAAPSRRAS